MRECYLMKITMFKVILKIGKNFSSFLFAIGFSLLWFSLLRVLPPFPHLWVDTAPIETFREMAADAFFRGRLVVILLVVVPSYRRVWICF